MEDICRNIEQYNIGKERRITLVFEDMIVDMINNKKLISLITELLMTSTKLNISLFFTTQSSFRVSKDVSANSTKFFILKIPN